MTGEFVRLTPQGRLAVAAAGNPALGQIAEIRESKRQTGIQHGKVRLRELQHEGSPTIGALEQRANGPR